MDKIARLRQEIERRRDICKAVFERESDTYYQGKAVAYDETLSFLDTLSEEPDKSLEDEMRSWFPDYSRGNASNLMERWGVAIARHFYELGKNNK